jgi:hypothetical protein
MAERDTSLVIECERCAISMTSGPLDGLAAGWLLPLTSGS